MVSGLVQRVARAAVGIAAHALVASTLLASLWGVEHLVRFISGEDELLFGRFPLSYMFQVGEVGTILVFIITGVMEAVRSLRDDHNE